MECRVLGWMQHVGKFPPNFKILVAPVICAHLKMASISFVVELSERPPSLSTVADLLGRGDKNFHGAIKQPDSGPPPPSIDLLPSIGVVTGLVSFNCTNLVKSDATFQYVCINFEVDVQQTEL